MFLDMSRTGEPHRGLGRLSVRKRTRWPHLCLRTAWIGECNPVQSPNFARAIGGKKPPLQHPVSPTDDDEIDCAGVDAETYTLDHAALLQIRQLLGQGHTS